MSKLYKCSSCGREFETKVVRDAHQQTCNMDKLTTFDNTGELRRLEGMSKALRANDYDKNDTKTGDSVQKRLDGRVARQKSINSF